MDEKHRISFAVWSFLCICYCNVTYLSQTRWYLLLRQEESNQEISAMKAPSMYMIIYSKIWMMISNGKIRGKYCTYLIEWVCVILLHFLVGLHSSSSRSSAGTIFWVHSLLGRSFLTGCIHVHRQSISVVTTSAAAAALWCLCSALKRFDEKAVNTDSEPHLVL